MAGEGRSQKGHPSGNRVRGLIIVARDEPDLWHYLTRDFAGNEGVQVRLDRRYGERRQRVQRCEPERRRTDRRRPLRTDNDLRCRPFLIIPQQQVALKR
mgnify:CR=1 FL=1|jgi:hypothetical protein